MASNLPIYVEIQRHVEEKLYGEESFRQLTEGGTKRLNQRVEKESSFFERKS